MRSIHSTHLLALACLISVASCNKSEPPKAAPPTVTINRSVERDAVDWEQFSGRLESPQTVNVSARVSGMIKSAPFAEGSLVKAGTVLFLIDDRPFKAELAGREAAVARSQATMQQAQSHFVRFQKLRDSSAISPDAYEQAASAVKQAQADLNAAKAAQDTAMLELEWTKVVAPIDGKVGRKLITEGNLVSGGTAQSTVLTTITSIDPLYCYVNVPERSLPKYQALTVRQEIPSIPCAAQLENESDFSHLGSVDFIDNHVDVATGTVRIRGVIPNSDGRLTAGLFAKLRVKASNSYKAVVVPDIAISTDQASRYVLVVGDDDVVAQRRVTVGNLFGTVRSITQGLKAGERVVVNGVQVAKPGMKVTVTEAPFAPDDLLAAAAPPTPTPVPATPLQAPPTPVGPAATSTATGGQR